MPTPSMTATITPSPTPGCTDLIVDGGFEWDDEAWDFPIPGRADYTTAYAHRGQRSMRVGIASGDNVRTYSTVWQAIHVPVNAQDPILTLWYYPISGDTVHDLQYALILDEHGVILDWVFSVRSDSQSWVRREYSLAEYQGMNVRVSFGVYNDGEGGITAMYVDDVSLPICGPQPTPSATPDTSSTEVFLPVILRAYSEQGALASLSLSRGEQYQVGPLQPAAVPAPSTDVRTLWAPAEPDVAPDFLQSVALDPTSDLLYLGAGKAVWTLNARTGAVVAHIPLDAAPRGIAVDPATDRIYVALWEADALAVIDAERHALWKIIPGIPGASGVAVGDDHVYVTATCSDELVVVDRQNCAIIARIVVGDAPYAVACDSGRRVYVGNAGDDTVSIVDGRIGTLVNTVRLGGLGHPHGLACDPIRDRLYVTYALSPKYRAVAAIDASSGQILSRLVGNEQRPLFGAYGIVVDPLRGWVHVTTGEDVLVLAGETLRVVKTTPGVGPAYAFGLCVSPVEERLYLADGRHGRLVVSGK